MGLLDVLRIVNVVLGLVAGVALVVASLSSRWAPSWVHGRPYVRFLQLGTGTVLLVISYATVQAARRHLPPSESTWLMTVALLWTFGGLVWAMVADWRGRRRARRAWAAIAEEVRKDGLT